MLRSPCVLWVLAEAEAMSGCYCVGPQNGEPLCPCRMRAVLMIEGRYVELMDYGPIPPLPVRPPRPMVAGDIYRKAKP